MMYLLIKFYLKIRTVAPYNQQSLQAKHGTKSLSTILTKHVTKWGQIAEIFAFSYICIYVQHPKLSTLQPI